LEKNYSYKTIIAFYCMLLYVTVIFKPLLPIINDELAHTFAEAIHIATVHAIYGENHLQKELSDTATDSNGKTQNTVKTEDASTPHIWAADTYSPSFRLSISNNYCIASLNKITAVFPSSDKPPPKIC
jgi:hypothetical protein